MMINKNEIEKVNKSVLVGEIVETKENSTLALLQVDKTNKLKGTEIFEGIGTIFLPRFSVFYPIQVESSADKAYLAYIQDGTSRTFIQTEYFLSFFCAKEQIKRRDKETGETERINIANLTELELKNHLASGFQKGYVACVLLQTSATNYLFCTLELYKTNLTYWKPVLEKVEFKNNKKARIEIIDHSANLIESSSQNKYLSNLSQYKIYEINKEEKVLINEQANRQHDQILDFLNN